MTHDPQMVCRGSWSLGTACGKCKRCLATRPLEVASIPQPQDRLVHPWEWAEVKDGDVR